jgi:hypothetical protein
MYMKDGSNCSNPTQNISVDRCNPDDMCNQHMQQLHMSCPLFKLNVRDVFLSFRLVLTYKCVEVGAI